VHPGTGEEIASMRRRRSVVGFALAALGGAACFLGCAHRLDGESIASVPIPRSPAERVDVAPPPSPPPEPMHGIPADLMDRLDSLSLADILDIALNNNPATRATWADARAAAAEVGSRRSAYYPGLDLEVSASKVDQTAVGGRFSLKQTSYGPALGLEYLLLDFGGRRGDLEEARQALVAADWLHNAAVNNVVLAVLEAYYGFLGAKAQADSAAVNVHEADVNLQAAEERRKAGGATIADGLQARTVRSRARPAQLTAEGEVRSLLGTLGTTLGLNANVAFDVTGRLPESAPTLDAAESVDDFVEEALLRRPELAAARALVLGAEGRERAARAEGLPSLELTGNLNRTYFDPSEYATYADNWSLGLMFRFPLFDGYRSRYETYKAREETEALRARAEIRKQTVTLEVWLAYQDLSTAVQRVATSRDLLASAEQNEQVALGRYKEGVGDILELLTAQALLASARAENIRARTDWFLSVARLAHAAGSFQRLYPVVAADSEQSDGPRREGETP